MVDGFGCKEYQEHIIHGGVVQDMNMHLKVIEEDSRYLWCECSKHDYLKKPPLCINKAEINGKPKGYGYCFSCAYRIDVPPEEVDKMSKKKTICRKSVPVDWIKLSSDYQMKSFIEGKYHILEQEWNVETLLKYGIGWDGEAHTFPMRREDGVIVGIQRRFPNGDKLCVPGSQLGLFMPNMQIVSPIVIVEGLSDASVATECGCWGLGLPSAVFGHAMAGKFLDAWNYSGKVLYVADANEAGKKSAEKMKKFLTNGFDYGIIQMEKYGDLREFYLNEGKTETVKLLKGD